MNAARIYNTCWMAYCARESSLYRKDCRAVASAQRQNLQQTLSKNQNTDFGRRHGFATIRDVDGFRANVPISSWQDIRVSVEEIASGRQEVLTHQPVSILEPTSGSTSGQKLIPYTPDLQRQFQRAIRVWIYDLMSNRKAVRGGRSYWSISPLATRREKTAGGIPIGFEHDSAYLSTSEQWILQHTLAVPPAAAHCQTVEAAQFATLHFLLRAPDLSLVSVWSPTFLTLLIDFFYQHADRLCDSITDGEFRVPANWGPIPQALQLVVRPSPRRSEQIRSILRGTSNTSDAISAVWPQLDLISCWADGPSAYFANDLRETVGSIKVQPKGLLATEAFVTIPLLGEAAPALAIRSHFFEFLKAGSTDASSTELAHELTTGEHYEVLVTTGGGLYRYRLHDVVEVVGHRGEAPLLKFVGRANQTVDLVGEKLSTAHVQSALDSACLHSGIEPPYAELVASLTPRPGYELVIAEPSLASSQDRQDRLRGILESGLCENPGYRYARSMNQIGPLRITVVTACEARARARESAGESTAAGVRYGDFKPQTLTRS